MIVWCVHVCCVGVWCCMVCGVACACVWCMHACACVWCMHACARVYVCAEVLLQQCGVLHTLVLIFFFSFLVISSDRTKISFLAFGCSY